jgi:uncharacterized damage-inducible protein DinB
MKPDHSSQIQRCEGQLKDFLAVALADGHGDLTKRSSPDKWSAHENLAHLGRYHEIFLERLHRILAEPNPAFARYRAEDDPSWDAWRQLLTSEVLDRMQSLRTKLVAELKQLSGDAFARTGVHPKFGKLTLAQWLEFFLVHEAHHLYMVFSQAVFHPERSFL